MSEINYNKMIIINHGLNVPTYGNYGGPGWSGGQYVNAGESPDFSVAPKNKLDALFKDHDISYENSTNYVQRYEADRLLYRRIELLKTDPEWSTYDWQDKTYANVISPVFEIVNKIAFGRGDRAALENGLNYLVKGLSEEILRAAPNLARCFLAGTPILLPDGSTAPIETIRPGDEVASFMGGYDFDGAAALAAPVVPGHVVRLLGSITTSVIAIHYEIDGAPYTIYATPLHVMLTGSGRWMQARDALMAGERFVAINGQLVEATYEMIQYGSARGEELTRTHAAFVSVTVTGQVLQDESRLAIAPRHSGDNRRRCRRSGLRGRAMSGRTWIRPARAGDSA